MADIPILMSAPMVRSTLDGRKTNTRRLAWRDHGATTADAMNGHSERVRTPTAWQKVKPGDLLWVRETFGRFNGCGTLTYKADEDDPMGSPEKWTPCIHMPRSVSRLTLEVTATKIERLQDISEADARTEGVEAKK